MKHVLTFLGALAIVPLYAVLWMAGTSEDERSVNPSYFSEPRRATDPQAPDFRMHAYNGSICLEIWLDQRRIVIDPSYLALLLITAIPPILICAGWWYATRKRKRSDGDDPTPMQNIRFAWLLLGAVIFVAFLIRLGYMSNKVWE